VGKGSEPIIDPVDGSVWRVDMEFLASNWRCLWGDGCQGILDRRAPELEQGCCSVGAEVLPEEAGLIEALGLSMDPARFQHLPAAADGGVFTDSSRSATRVVDGACIFLNRPGFAGGVGCALHLAAVDDKERPMDYKPAICWQLPLKAEVDADGVHHLRRWWASDWGDERVAWCCTDRAAEPSAYMDSAPVAESLFDELRAIVGPEVAVEIRKRVLRT
jgi:hypothetical protein